MAPRLFAALIALTTSSLLPCIAMAQGRTAARTPWGDPDLSGLWTNATLTVLQRPAELAGKEFFTAEEAATFEQTRIAQTNVDRPAREGEVGAYNNVFFERGKRGVKSRRTSLVVEPRDGRIPPFTPDARQKVDAREVEEALSPADGPESRWLTERCILFGSTVPMMPEPYNNNYSIVQTPGYVTILVEMNHDVRIIPLDGRPHLSKKIQQWIGDSRGHWEGDTLVVETTNLKFNDKSRFGVGFLGGLSDQNLRIVERFSRADADTLNYQATIEDPTVFTRNWTIEQSMDRTKGPLFEVACHEGNYGLGFILSGHRADERGTAEAARSR